MILFGGGWWAVGGENGGGAHSYLCLLTELNVHESASCRWRGSSEPYCLRRCLSMNRKRNSSLCHRWSIKRDIFDTSRDNYFKFNMSALGYGIAAVTAGLWAWKERRELMAGLPSDEALRAAATFSSRFAISPPCLFSVPFSSQPLPLAHAQTIKAAAFSN